MAMIPGNPMRPGSDDEGKDIKVTLSDAQQGIFEELAKATKDMVHAAQMLSGTVKEQMQAAQKRSQERRDAGSYAPGSFMALAGASDAGVPPPPGGGGSDSGGSGGGGRRAGGVGGYFSDWSRYKENERQQRMKSFGFNDFMHNTVQPTDPDFLKSPRFGGFTLQDTLAQMKWGANNFGLNQKYDPLTGRTSLARPWTEDDGLRGIDRPADGLVAITPEEIAKDPNIANQAVKNKPLADKAVKAGLLFGAGENLAGVGSNLARLPGNLISSIGQYTFGPDRSATELGYRSDPWFGAGMQEMWRQRIEGAGESWFGLNPYFSGKDAKQLTSALHQLGWRGNDYDKMFGLVSDVKESTNMDIGLAAQISDPAYRVGTANVDQLKQLLKYELPDAAKAANMSINDLAKQMVSSAQAMSQNTPVPAFVAQQSIASGVAGTGMTPDRVGAMQGSNFLEYMWLGSHPGSTPYDYEMQNHQGKTQQGLDTAFRALFAGRPISDMAKDESFRKHVYNTLRWGGPQYQKMLGENYQQLLNMANDGGMARRAVAEDNIQTIGSKLASTNYRALIENGQSYNVNDTSGRQHINAEIAKQLEAGGVSTNAARDFIAANGHGSMQQELQKASRMIGDLAQKAQRDAAKKTDVQITLKGDAAKWLSASVANTDENTPTNKSYRPGLPPVLYTH